MRKCAPFSTTQLGHIRQCANLPLPSWMRGPPIGQVLGRTEQIHQRAVGWTSSTAAFHTLRIPDPSTKMACAHQPTCLELDLNRGSALLTGCLGDCVLAETRWNSDCVVRTPRPEVATTQAQSMLPRRDQRQSRGCYDAAVRVQHQTPTD